MPLVKYLPREKYRSAIAVGFSVIALVSFGIGVGLTLDQEETKEVVKTKTVTVTSVITSIPEGMEDGFCQEDEPCWNCETMGNLICGPGAKK